jgi:hypothetical protein
MLLHEKQELRPLFSLVSAAAYFPVNVVHNLLQVQKTS